MRKTLRLLAYLLAFLSAGMSLLLFHKNKAPQGFMLWFPKLVAGALSPFFALAGALGVVLGAISNAPLAVLSGLIGAGAMARYVRRVTAPHAGFEKAFGPGWAERIPQERRRRLLPQRWTWKLTPVPELHWERDLPFWTLPGTSRKLLCDVWRPPAGVQPSGLAFIYFHGSAWFMMDKDYGTRPFFRHLAGQGHVVMDVAYRLAPEADMTGMVGDVKRAVAWMKANAGEYGVNPQCIVVGGGSAGGHLALLAAYSPDHAELTPDDVPDADLAVRGVIAEYGPANLAACYYHTNQHKIPRPAPGHSHSPSPAAGAMAIRMKSVLGDNYVRLGFEKGLDAGSFVKLFGGDPDELPETYALFSPLTHVHPGCPPTLLIQGEDDLITPLGATRDLYNRLVRAGVPAVLVVFPHTDHGFDLLLPELSPSAQAALHDVERFLAVLAA
jgi:acetyl esterase/lipase